MANLVIENVETFSPEQLKAILAIVAKNQSGNVEQVVEDSKKQRKAPTPKPKVEKTEPGEDSDSETETLHCENGDHDYQRPRSRGRKPKNCPDHPDGGSNSDSEPDNDSEDDSDELLGELLGDEDEVEVEEKPKPKRQPQRMNNSENMVPKNALIDPADEDDLETVKAEIEAADGKFEFHRVGLKNLDDSKCSFVIVWSKKNNCNYYKVGEGEDAVWAKYGSTDEFLADKGFKRINQRANLAAKAVYWSKGGKSRVYVNPDNKDYAGGGWFVKPRS